MMIQPGRVGARLCVPLDLGVQQAGHTLAVGNDATDATAARCGAVCMFNLE